MSRIGVILAGGRGERMAAGRNKVLLELAGRPILAYSLATFRRCCDHLLVVAAEADQAAIAELASDLDLVPGGASRHGSEWNALQRLKAFASDGDVIAIHDAARPLVADADVVRVFEEAGRFGAAMLAQAAEVPALEALAGLVTRTYAAAEVWRAQTPQGAHAALLFDAYRRAASDGFSGTDTAAVLARAGYPVRIVAATADNPKVTVPADLEHALSVLARRGSP
ncbi:MAG: 2-C-methyl-D-erythritol 4-phosphate cytidylyltransferase [Chloroflexi bacterium]|nr:2-C-methyl-D-erythritol 4-phosphate cytidylyltransferase [Chloroflexota bacterium]